jgi:hypothetical protein
MFFMLAPTQDQYKNASREHQLLIQSAFLHFVNRKSFPREQNIVLVSISNGSSKTLRAFRAFPTPSNKSAASSFKFGAPTAAQIVY